MLQKLGTAQEVKRHTSMVILHVGLCRTIRVLMSRRVGLTAIARIGEIKAILTMAAMGGTEAGAKTGVEGGRLHNDHRGDPMR